MSDTTHLNSSGIGFFGLLTIVFITLKLCGVITWSWWLVLLPIFISWGIALVIVAVGIGILALVAREEW